MMRSAQTDRVKTAVIQILIEGGDTCDKKDTKTKRPAIGGRSVAHGTGWFVGVLIQD